MRLNLFNTFKQSVKIDNFLFCFGPKNTRHTKKIFALLENNFFVFFLIFKFCLYRSHLKMQVSQTFNKKSNINGLCEALQYYQDTKILQKKS